MVVRAWIKQREFSSSPSFSGEHIYAKIKSDTSDVPMGRAGVRTLGLRVLASALPYLYRSGFE